MIYFDSSALVKLVIKESESEALGSFVAEQSDVPHVASALVITELRRTLLRSGAPPAAYDKAQEVLDGVALLPVNPPTLEHAGVLPGPDLRSLDAIHLASALRLRSALTALVTYDQRMRAAAADAGVPTVTPS